MRLFIFLLTFCFCFSVEGTISWSSVQDVTTEPGIKDYEMSIDSEGNIYAIWDKNGQVETAYKASQGHWTEPTLMAMVPSDKSHFAIETNVTGEVHALWVEEDLQGNFCLKTAYRSLFEGWSSPKLLVSGFCDCLKLSRNSSGTMYAIWRNKDKEKSTVASIQVAEKKFDSDWSIPRNLTTQLKIGIPDIQVDDRENVYAIWCTGDHYIQGTHKLAGEAWTNTFDMFTKPGLFWGYNRMKGVVPKLKVNSEGDLFAICYTFSARSFKLGVLFSEKKYLETNWSIPRSITEHSSFLLCFCPDLAFNKTGDIFVAWSNGEAIECVHYDPSSGWVKPKKLSLNSSKGKSTCPHVVIDSNGHAIVIWGFEREGQSAIQYAVHTSEQGWLQTESIPLNGSCTNIWVAMDTVGNLYVSWLEGPKEQWVIKSMMGKF